MTREKVTLDEIVRDSRELLEPDMMGKRVDWEKLEEKLFARVQAAQDAMSNGCANGAKGANGENALGKRRISPLAIVTPMDLRNPAWARGWATAAAALAIAAAIPMLLGRPSTGPTAMAPLESATMQESHAERIAGALAWKEGSGEVRLASSQIASSQLASAEAAPLMAMSAGSALERGDAVETHGVRAGFERRVRDAATPGAAAAEGALAVSWALEDSSRFLVKGTHGALILGLERGAVEAQVTPVPNGEAFAVDVDGARVAVHGTHLRVARDGSHVIVDLTEGVVSIGVPPRAGSTYGKLVNAPAHIEFDANDPHGTLKVTHAADRVRAAIALRPAPETLATVTPRVQIAPEKHPQAPGAASTLAPMPAIASTPTLHAPPMGIAPKPEAEPHLALARAPDETHGNETPAAPAHAADAHPEQTIANAVRECMNARASTHPEDVVVTVTSTLELRVGNEGAVEIAKFVPPLEPEVQTCASRVIYKAKFAQPGNVSIPLDLRR